ncbi:arylesterase [Thalassotalea psychrophila]|uniref:Arylesterase n=1 Tax=Thalassotalea psychrophila TaxID=3065647 RepID=A0ABY9TZV4_9GAMM|nr:arylesterase [Colwelliaceae bacterium SQ149]
MLKKLTLSLLFILTSSLSISVLAQQSILLLGDSLSASYGMQEKDGWVMLLNNMLKQEKAEYRIVNASISGETTGGGLARLPGILEKNNIDYLLIELGGNDGLRGFPPKLIKNNLLQIIELAKSKNIKVLLSAIRIPPNYGPRYNKMFSDVFANAAQESTVTLLPFFIESVAGKPELMQADGIHPTIEAQPLLAQEMKKLLNAALLKFEGNLN